LFFGISHCSCSRLVASNWVPWNQRFPRLFCGYVYITVDLIMNASAKLKCTFLLKLQLL
jgi:hypothetical protein